MMINEVKRLVAAFYGVTRDELEGAKGARHIAWARQSAMTMCRHFTRHSYPQIGRSFRRDHTTAIYAHKMVLRRIASDPVQAAEMLLLAAQIEAGAVSTVSAWAAAARAARVKRPAKEDLDERAALVEQTSHHRYAAALSAANANFATRDAGAPSFPASALSGPRVLRLRGPDFFSKQARAA